MEDKAARSREGGRVVIRKPLTGAITHDEFRAAWTCRVPTLEIAQRCGFSVMLAYRAAAELGLPPRLRGGHHAGPERAQQDAEIRRLWGTGMVTAEIGRRLSISKNAVVGRAHRMGLPGRGSPIVARKRVSPAWQAAVGKATPVAPPPPVAAIAAPPPTPGPRLCPVFSEPALPVRPCQFPLWPHNAVKGHPAWGTLCGAPRCAGSSYCDTHRRICVARRVSADEPLEAA